MKRKAIEQFLKYTSKETSKKGKSKVTKMPEIENMKSMADDFFKDADDFIKKYKRKDID